MSITSLDFCLFYLLFYIGYWLLKDNYKIQNIYVLATSYLFYSLIDWRFSFLLLFISLFSYYIGILIKKKPAKYSPSFLLTIAVVVNVGILFIFKYYDFFASELSLLFGLNNDKILLNLILPVGISFYIFTATGYVIDIYKGTVEPTKEIVPFLSFISFFPLLLSGPIERSNGLLPQFKKKRSFDKELAFNGIQQVVWGAFKKLVIADNCATIVQVVFANYTDMPASSLLIGGILYSFQIYFDFSGYSDIAIGLSKLLGLKVRRNFNYPYFAMNVSDFWRRWHMSLQSWLTDYVYFPLGGSRCSKSRTIYNTFIVFLLCGIWHGANWTFFAWGAYHALLFVPLLLLFSKEFKKKTVDDEGLVPSLKSIIQMLITFLLITIGWIMFNSPSLSVGINYIFSIFSPSILCAPTNLGLVENIYTLLLIIFVFIFEWINKEKEIPLFFKCPVYLKILIIYLLLGHIVLCNASQTDFIYYQF